MRLQIYFFAFFFLGCASKSSREIMEEKNQSSRASAASYAADGFYLNYRNPPDRQNTSWDFFYKHCKLVGRDNPAPNRSECECSNPD